MSRFVSRNGLLQVVCETFSCRNRSIDKPNEDGFWADAKSGAFCIADGVTRSRSSEGAYPNPSPAKKAADIAVQTAARMLVASPRTSPEQVILSAFRAANEAIASYADTLPRADYWCNDYPGAVATMLVIDQDLATYAHLGDCMLLHLNERGDATRLTEDQTANAQRWFQSQREKLSEAERYKTMRQKFRNTEDSEYRFGVLTGESAALTFVTVGERRFAPGDVLVMLSDGFGSVLPISPERGPVSLKPDVLEDLFHCRLEILARKTEKADEDLGKKSDDKTAIHIALQAP